MGPFMLSGSFLGIINPYVFTNLFHFDVNKRNKKDDDNKNQDSSVSEISSQKFTRAIEKPSMKNENRNNNNNSKKKENMMRFTFKL
jgi:hypothetical protein